MRARGCLLICTGVLAVCAVGCSAPGASSDGGSRDGGGARDAGGVVLDAGGVVDGGRRDGGPSPSLDGGGPLDGGDGGFRFTIEEDPACACGVMGRASGIGGQNAVFACPCFAIPPVAFDCERDSDCVRFDSTCEGCRSYPAISINRIWSGCLEEYKRQYCGRYEEWGTGANSCCTGCVAHLEPPCQPRCVNHRCWVDPPSIPGFNDGCAFYRDPDGGFFVTPYPYPVDGGPHAQCGD